MSASPARDNPLTPIPTDSPAAAQAADLAQRMLLSIWRTRAADSTWDTTLTVIARALLEVSQASALVLASRCAVYSPEKSALEWVGLVRVNAADQPTPSLNGSFADDSQALLIPLPRELTPQTINESPGAVPEIALFAYDAAGAVIPRAQLSSLRGALRVASHELERALLREREGLTRACLPPLDRLAQAPFEALGVAAQAISATLGFEACTLLQAERSRRVLLVIGTTGINSPLPQRKLQYPMEFSCSGWVAQNRQLLVLEDFRTFPGHSGPRFPDRVATPDRRQYLGAPIVSSAGELLGVLRLRNRCGGTAAGQSPCLSELDCLRALRAAEAVAPLLAMSRRESQIAATLARVRHDLDMPATAVRDGAGVLLRENDAYFRDNLPGVRQKLEDIESFAEILLVNSEMMSLADAEDVALRPESVLLLSGFVAKLCKMLSPAARRRGLSGILYNQGSFFAIPALWLDPRLFQIALYNVLQNALKYSDPGSYVSVEAEATKPEGRPTYLIHVKNTGIGIAEDEREMIFQRYFRSPRARRRSDAGLGIGLPTARAFIERHGGQLLLSRPHQPTIFTIQLPGYLAYRKPS